MTPCILWEGAKHSKGYGLKKVGGKMVRVHRLAYEEKFGPIPDGMMVLHRCDVRACHNVDHLFLGTAKDNYDDARSKGRHTRGHGKLSPEIAHEIRASNETYAVLANRYGVSTSTILNTKKGKCHVEVES